MEIATQKILEAFDIKQQLNATIFGTGLIHKTYILGTEPIYLLQHFNHHVFKNPLQVYENVNTVYNHLKQQNAPIKIIPQKLTKNQQPFFIYQDTYWRLFDFEQNAIAYALITNADQAYMAAEQFGLLSYYTDGLDISRITYTIPDFHNLEKRYQHFNDAIQRSTPDAEISNVIAFYQNQFDILNAYHKITSNHFLPLRVVHNDTKISNVLFHDVTKKAIAVVDLDTLMPGYFFSDVGDMIRTYISETTEESDIMQPVKINLSYLSALLNGYKDGLKHTLTANEKEAVKFAGPILIYMTGLRFITDFLNHNIYFKVSHPLHNLNRAINQMNLLQCYNTHASELNSILSA
jgi:Ser/Thr protein kinase RdoA (MazF antagonist)